MGAFAADMTTLVLLVPAPLITICRVCRIALCGKITRYEVMTAKVAFSTNCTLCSRVPCKHKNNVFDIKCSSFGESIKELNRGLIQAYVSSFVASFSRFKIMTVSL